MDCNNKSAKCSKDYRINKRKQKVDELIEQCTFRSNQAIKSDHPSIIQNVSESEDQLKDVNPNKKVNKKSDAFDKRDNDQFCNNGDNNDLSLLKEPQEINELREWIVNSNIPHVEADKLLVILKRRLLPELPKTTATLLGKSSSVQGIIQIKASKNERFREFFYFGLESKLKRVIIPKRHLTNEVELIFNIDGFSRFKSSALQVWPILCKVYSGESIYEPFSVAVYAGKSKPYDPNIYLKELVQELNRILLHGIHLENKTFGVKIENFICDRPAQAFIKNTVGHTAANGCERCTVEGKKHDGVMAFLDLNASKRTDISFRSFDDPDYHIGASILCYIEPPVDMITTFVLDTVHLLRAVVTDRIIDFLMQPSNRKVRLSADLKKELQRRTKMIGSCIPKEFPRKMRPIEDHSNHKSVEFKFFLDYAAPIVMKKLLSKELYNHLMLLALSCRILSGSERMTYISKCRSEMQQFVKEASAEDRYGPSFVTLNVHDLIHLCDDIEITGCDLNELSAFSFESYLGIMSNCIKSPLHVVAQYCNRVEEKEKYVKVSVKSTVDIEILRQTKKEIVSVRYKNFILSTMHPDNTVLLSNGHVGLINEILTDNAEFKIRLQKYSKMELLFSGTWHSDLLNIYEVSQLSNDISVTTLKKVKKNDKLFNELCC